MANKLNYNFKNLPDESGDSVSAEWLNEVQKGHNETLYSEFTPGSRNGTTTYYFRRGVKMGNVVHLSIFAAFSKGAGTKPLFDLPKEYRPSSSRIVVITTTQGSAYGFKPLIITADGEIYFYVNEQEADKVYHINASYII